MAVRLVCKAALIACLLWQSQALAQSAPSIAGIWLDDEGKGAVEITPCGDRMCGKIVWLKNPLSPNGTPWTDKLNPDPTKQLRPVCGLQIIGDAQKNGDKWDGGWIYDPEEGKTWQLELSLKDANTMSVHGYAVVTLLGETSLWTRLPANAARCKG